MKNIIMVLLTSFSLFVLAGTFETENYIVEIESACEEGDVSCDKFTYIGTSKKSGKSITLSGSSWHTKDKDGNPGRFLGYKFKNGNIIYYVTEAGELSVVRNRTEVLVEESGTWKY